MKRRISVATVCGMLGLLLVGVASGAEPADLVSRDVFVYVEAGPALTQELIGAFALPPVAGLFMPSDVATPFGHVERLLDVAPGTVSEAARHLRKVAMAGDAQGVAFLFAFDDPDGADALLGELGGRAGEDFTARGRPPVGVRDGVAVVGMKRMVNDILQGDYAPLAGEAGFRAAQGKAGNAPLWAYVAAQPLMAAILDEIGSHDAMVMDAFVSAMGLDKAQFGLVTMHREQDAASGLIAAGIEAVIGFADETAPVLALLPQEMTGTGSVPAGTPMSLAIRWGDAADVYARTISILTEVDNSIGQGEIQAGLDQIKQGFGFGLDEFFATLGSGGTAYVPSGGAGALMRKEDWTVSVELKDAASFERMLRAVLANAIGAGLTAETHEGVEVMRVGMLPVVCRIDGDAAVFSGSAGAVKAHLNAAAGAAAPALVSLQADLGLLLSSYPATESGAKVRVRAWREGREVRLSAAVEDVDMAQFGRMCATTYPAVVSAMVLPALTRARGQAYKASSMNNLKQIGLALEMHRIDRGEATEALGDLYPDYIDNEGVFVDPKDRAPVPRGDAGLAFSYEYAGRLPVNVPPQTILCYSRKGVHEDGRVVLYRDGHVGWSTEAELIDPWAGPNSLGASYDAVVAAYGDALTPERDAELRAFYELDDDAGGL